MPKTYEQQPEGIIINSKLLAINSKLIKRVLIANCFNGFSIKFKQTNQKFITWKTSQSIHNQWRIYDRNDEQFFLWKQN